MRIIKSQRDVHVLRRARALPVEILDLVEDYFNQLKAELEVEVESDFRLGRHGYIVVSYND